MAYYHSISSLFFHLDKALFSAFLQFKVNFVHGQSRSIYPWSKQLYFFSNLDTHIINNTNIIYNNNITNNANITYNTNTTYNKITITLLYTNYNIVALLINTNKWYLLL